MNRRSLRIVLGFLCSVAWAITGCAARLPAQPWVDDATALAMMARRADSTKAFSSPCRIYLKRHDGYTVTLDGAVAAKIPGWLRVRAWKFGNAVLDVTVTPEGVWMLREGGGDAPQSGPPAVGAERLAGVWAMFTGRFFDDPGAHVIDTGGPRFTVERPLGDGGATARCEIDRATLTARTYVITDSGGAVRLTLTLDRYRLIGRTPWPMRLTAEIAPGASAAERRADVPARVTIHFDDAEINPDLPSGAFVPPRRAIKQP